MTQQYTGSKIVTAWPQQKDGQTGYAVKYTDGYTSWSPAATFEAAYLPLGNIEHLPPHQQRVLAERAELDSKVSKLSAFLDSERVNTLPDREAELLIEQLGHMRSYAAVLDQRIADFPVAP